MSGLDATQVTDDRGGLMTSWGALVVLCLTMFIVVLDTSMMNVAVLQQTLGLDALGAGVVLLPLS
ncbi:MAG: hypothetical protein U9N79_02195, partial [Actinomycetota bacterium]|nr:hypothetical protein [Actinomycetota bacterium]